MDNNQDIIFSEIDGASGIVGHILLNRPKALNALSKTMCMALGKQLQQWENNSNIKAIMIEGAGDRAFCAGGDVRQLFASEKQHVLQHAMSFFKQEYATNAILHHLTKPYIAFLDGITMGGGAGVSVHGKFRVATEKLRFAMPETAIGFFPDIGAGYFLTRCPNKIGWYLGLTGNTIKAADALAMGLVTHYVLSEKLQTLKQSIIESSFDANHIEQIDELLRQFTTQSEDAEIWQHANMIEHCFSKTTVEAIIQALKDSKTDFGQQTVDVLLRRSPISLKITLAHLNRCANKSFDEIIQSDYQLAEQFMQGHDFCEGVRAALIDKDQNPKWQPDALSKVTDDDINAYLSS